MLSLSPLSSHEVAERQVWVPTILGIDAAWTEKHPSGVALVQETAGGWRCVAVAPSYSSFLALADGVPIDWSFKPTASFLRADALIKAAHKFADGEVDVVSVDIPLATLSITRGREADRAVSREFAKNWCGTHSPTVQRPGVISEDIRNDFENLGYSLATKSVSPPSKALIECYPHPALLVLCNRDRRLAYKVSKVRLDDRTAVVDELNTIISKLDREITGARLLIPALPVRGPLAALKRWEDVVDALVAAWVGITYLEGTAEPYGDATAAIWIPRSCDVTG
jgi:predicted RNase H-like nuclease